MQNFVIDKRLNYNIINSVTEVIDPNEKNIFIFTPERAIQLMALYPDIKIDFFFFDEMYKEDEDFASCSSKENDETEALSKEEKVLKNPLHFWMRPGLKHFGLHFIC